MNYARSLRHSCCLSLLVVGTMLSGLACSDDAGAPSVAANITDTGTITPGLDADPAGLDSARVGGDSLGDSQGPAFLEPGKIGWPCLTNDECDSDWCVQTPQGKQCSQLCIDSCPDGWGCKKVETLGGDEVLICLPLYPHLCEPCEKDTDCTVGLGDIGDLCLPRPDGQGSFCGGDCSTGSPCPEGYTCEDIASGPTAQRQCVPIADECECNVTAVARQASTTCTNVSELGTCTGVRTCTPDGLTDCSAPIPTEEACDGADNDCDGITDNPGTAGCINYYQDLDKDNYGDPEQVTKCICGPEGTYTAVETGDCDDLVSALNPGATELCTAADTDAVDEDCDSATDEAGALGCTTYFADKDGDSWGDTEDVQCLCAPSAPYTAQKGEDCDDDDKNTYPGAIETCSGGDTNCDNQVAPENTPGCANYYLDSDEDSYGQGTLYKCLCAPSGAYTALVAGDCNDDAASINPSADETCDNIDNDCDDVTDEADATDCETYYQDADQDSYGTALSTKCLCDAVGSFSSLLDGDCNDANPDIHPGAQEGCNTLDDDCDNETDEPDAQGCSIYYEDTDEDGFGTVNFACLCAPNAPYEATKGGDCDDTLSAVAPDQTETCDEVDNNCNGATDEADAEGCEVFFLDNDEDTFGVTDEFQCLCEPTGAFTAPVGGDCVDSDVLVNPGVTEVCDETDNNCDGATDEAGATGCSLFYEDLDKDDWGVTSSSSCLCGPTFPYLAAQPGDCKDGNEDIHPGAIEVCGDGVDNNCNDLPDEEGGLNCTIFFQDVDGDTFGVLGTDKCLCQAEGTWTASKGGDCDDTPTGGLIFPGEACTPASCTGALLTKATLCTGAAVCEGGETVPCPGGFICADNASCLTHCVDDSDCIDDNFCVAGQCSGKKADGSQCFEDTQCISDHCANNFCCSNDGSDPLCCGGSASHCANENPCTLPSCNADFQCTFEANDGAICAAPVCDNNIFTSSSLCLNGSCTEGGSNTDCQGSNPCEVYTCTLSGCTVEDADPGTLCAAQTCADATVTAAKTCNGQGACSTGGFSSPCPGGLICQDNTTCLSQCAQDADCQSTHFCDNGQCLLKKPSGGKCNQSKECVSDYCNNGFCCQGGVCCGGGAADCHDDNPCTTDICTPTFTCSHQNNTAECATGQCLDNTHTKPRYCNNGQCAPATASESCQGANPCLNYGCLEEGCTTTPAPIGTQCASPSCTGFTLTSAVTCNGEGGCALGGATAPCPGGLQCASSTTCASSCNEDADCQLGLWCNDGFCLPKGADGEPCNNSNQCTSGHCENNFCCANGTCCNNDVHCNDGNICTKDKCSLLFTCTQTYNNGAVCNDGFCDGLAYTEPKTCFLGQCGAGGTTQDCGGTNPCRAYSCGLSGCEIAFAPAGTPCAGSTCVNAQFTAMKSCNPTGQCFEGGGQAPCPGGLKCANATDCATQCTGDADCQTGWFCTANSCQLKRVDGDFCSTPNECLSDYCSNNICCDGGNCCQTSQDCDDQDPCTTDNCTANFQCDATPSNAVCVPGSCNGLIYTHPKTCSALVCDSGGGIQVCGTGNPCKNDTCTGEGGCQSEDAVTGTQCTEASCLGHQLTAPMTCNGSGNCQLGGGTSPCPGGFACESPSKCRNTCSATSHCAPGFFCGAGLCQPKRVNGDACSTTEQCTSNYCSNGYCCDGPGKCCSQSFHCNDNNVCTTDVCLPSSNCQHTDNTLLCETAKCDGLQLTKARYCQNGSCTNGGQVEDCSGTAVCSTFACTPTQCTVGQAAAGVQCAAQSCSGFTLTQASTCNGGGICNAGLQAPCPGGLVCAVDTLSCKATCSEASDCQPGYYCDAAACQPLRVNGDGCAKSLQCSSGYCANGYCCENDGSSPLCCGGSNNECDDGNFCTQDTCGAGFRCTSVNSEGKICADASCNGITYTSIQICVNGACTGGGLQQDCVANDPCIDSVCTATGCQTQGAAFGTPCQPSSCSGYTLTGSQSCDGNGSCTAGANSGPCPGGFLCATGTTCNTACTQDDQCQPGLFCAAPNCVGKKPNGSQCGGNNECVSAYCQGGYCCDSGNCCGTVAQCDDSNICTTDACDNNQCAHSNNTLVCSAGVCEGLTYMKPRVCAGGLCPPTTETQSCDQPNPCKNSLCNSLGCDTTNSPQGTQCAGAVCTGALLTQARTCNGSGLCLAAQTAPCPGNLRCANQGSCYASCTTDTQCVAGNYCSAGQCLAKKASGSTCGSANECLSEHCSNSVCCAGGSCCAVTAQCEDGNPCTTESCTNFQCNSFNNSDLCQPANCTNLLHTAATFCQNGNCTLGGDQSDCSGSNACRVYSCSGAGCASPPAVQGTTCVPALCNAGILTQAELCDGGGNCSQGGTTGPCPGNFECKSSTECLTVCATDADCQSDYYCQGGSCLGKRNNGESCSGQNQCLSDWCSNGYCCTPGNVCCAASVDCNDSNGCTTDTCQNSVCQFTNNTAPCGVGFCLGLLHTSAPLCENGLCSAGSTQTNCAGSDPCKAYGCTPNGCSLNNQPAGTQCAPSSCSNATLTTALSCTSNGTCAAGGVEAPCPGNMTCKTSTTCHNQCLSDSHCVDGYYCQGGACLPKKPDGGFCTTATQCQSAYCNNFTCCAGGQCCTNDVACTDTNLCTTDTCLNFTCTQSFNTAPCAASSCNGLEWTAPKVCKDGSCTGGGEIQDCSGDNACLTYQCANFAGCSSLLKSEGTICSDAICADKVFTPASVCDATGSCVGSLPVDCDDEVLCNGVETCSVTQGCVAGNTSDIFVCGDGTCTSACETAENCATDCTCTSSYTLQVGEFDAWNTISSGSTSGLDTYGCSTSSYPGNEYTYRVVAPFTGQLEVQLLGADSETELFVLEQSPLGCDPAQCSAQITSGGTKTSWAAVAGKTYYLVIDRKAAGGSDYQVYVHYTAGTCYIPFKEHWDRAPFPRAWTTEPNWQVSQDSPFGAYHAKFTGSPTLTNFSRSLTSPVFDTSNCSATALSVDWRFLQTTPHAGVFFSIEVSSNAGQTWVSVFSYDTGSGDQPPTTQNMLVSGLANTSQARIRLRIHGDTSEHMNKLQVDTVQVSIP